MALVIKKDFVITPNWCKHHVLKWLLGKGHVHATT
jgi:hypothetical protein